MNIFKLLSALAEADPAVLERPSVRRTVLSSLGRKAAAALPLAFGAMLPQAYGRDLRTIQDVLNLALTLEHLENEFYLRALAQPAAFFPTGTRPATIDSRSRFQS